MRSEAPCRVGGLSGTCLLFTSYFKFNNPKSNIVQFSKILNVPHNHKFLYFKNIRKKNHPKILKKLLNPGLKANWVTFWLNEILAINYIFKKKGRSKLKTMLSTRLSSWTSLHGRDLKTSTITLDYTTQLKK